MEINVAAILLQMLNFGILVGALTYFLIKPVRSVLENRSRRIAEGQAAADAALAEKAQIDDLKAQSKKDAQQEAKTVIATAREEAETRKAEMMQEAQAEVEAVREKMLKNLEKEKAALVKEWQAQFEDAVMAVSEQVIGKSLKAEDHKKLFEKGLQDIVASK